VARAYTISTAALTLQTSVKWLDNVLSHHTVSGVHAKRQGVARRLGIEAILILAVVVLLVQDLGLPIPDALWLAEALVKADGAYQSRGGLSVRLELMPLRENLLKRLEAAVETAPIPRRGRPPANKTGRLT
jgi:hypothetical protein